MGPLEPLPVDPLASFSLLLNELGTELSSHGKPPF
jgi:hypothetical protein